LLGWIAGDVIATDPAVQPVLDRVLDGKIAISLDATSSIFGWAPHLRLDGDLDEYICSVVGAIFVLVVGTLWRRSKLRHIDRLVVPVAGEAARPVDPA
jgi:uncharacterized membrane protein YeaQ/YmgE (transglycosylase-associated protein family)